MPIPPFTDEDPSLGMADGYAVQQMVGVDSPNHGPVLALTVRRDGDTIPLDRFIAPKIEAEIVFVLGSRLRGPGVTVTQAHAAVADRTAIDQLSDDAPDLDLAGGYARESLGALRESGRR